MVDKTTTIKELMQYTSYIDIELISDTKEEALEKNKILHKIWRN